MSFRLKVGMGAWRGGDGECEGVQGWVRRSEVWESGNDAPTGLYDGWNSLEV